MYAGKVALGGNMIIFENLRYKKMGLKIVEMPLNFVCSCFMYIKKYRG
jgi:hypothetical protein